MLIVTEDAALLASHRNRPPMPRARFGPPLVGGGGGGRGRTRADQGAAPLSEPVVRAACLNPLHSARLGGFGVDWVDWMTWMDWMDGVSF